VKSVLSNIAHNQSYPRYPQDITTGAGLYLAQWPILTARSPNPLLYYQRPDGESGCRRPELKQDLPASALGRCFHVRLKKSKIGVHIPLGGRVMGYFRNYLAVTLTAVVVPIQAARAQALPGTSVPARTLPAVRHRPVPLPTARPQIEQTALWGKWSGTLIEVQNSIEYSVAVEISSDGATITYPELGCRGILRPIGSSAEYVFFVEAIKNGSDGAPKCRSGVITASRHGDKLAWDWFCVSDDNSVVALGTLSRDRQISQPMSRVE